MDTILDLPSVLERLDDDRDLLKELAQLFLEQVPRQLSRIQQAVQAGDAKTLRDCAHALKGSAGTLAGMEVSRTAAELEKMGREGDLTDSRAACVALEAQLERLTAALQTLVESDAN